MASDDYQTLTVITLQGGGHTQEAFALDVSLVIGSMYQAASRRPAPIDHLVLRLHAHPRSLPE
jgi:hypothetical protein